MISSDLTSRMVAYVAKHRSCNLEKLCDVFDISPSKCRKLIEKSGSKCAVALAGATFGVRPYSPPDDIITVPIKQAGVLRPIGVMSDIHVGSKYCLVAQIRDFVRIAWGRGVRQILVPGDLLDGCYPHGRWELKYHGFQEQVAALENVLPSKPGLDYYGIAGNHDETFERDSGMVSYINIEDYFVSHGRKDMHMLGSRGAYVRLRTNSHHRGLVVHLWHPTRARAYALSYQLQKQVERYSPGLKPDILLAGHWHQSCYCAIRGVHALSCGTFQGGGSAYGKSLGGSPTIGGWIIEYAMTSDGTIRSFRPEWVGYFEKETVREVMI